MRFRTLTCITAMTLFVALGLPGNAGAQTFTSLFAFDSTDGHEPVAALIQATDGNFYGTAFEGGANTSTLCDFGYGGGCGTVFKITPSGTLTTLYNFCSKSGCTDGGNPVAGLVQGTDGSFYGTTYSGGTHDCDLNGSPFGCGTIFKITSGGTLTTMHSFAGYPSDGAFPQSALVQATNGNLYGTTPGGGAITNSTCENLGYTGCGLVFDITPSGTLSTVYNFCSQSGCTDGEVPFAGLVQDTDGNFYGTTLAGGASNSSCPFQPRFGCGTVFKMTSRGQLTTLHSFDYTDGALPYATLLQATNGDFYGTTETGGGSEYYGTVFKITAGGTLTALHSFYGTDGASPRFPLVQATDGNLYGATYDEGARGGGTIFKITLGGALTTLHTFCSLTGCRNGSIPAGALVQDTDGNLYGMTVSGGNSDACPSGQNNGCGTVFSLSVGLGPFVKTLPASGEVGAAVGILRTSLTGATSVTFNGTPAAFTLVSASVIDTTVPAGATTGTVQVVTPGGTLTSYVNFQVLP